MSLSPNQKLSAARLKAVAKAPYLASAVLNVTPKLVPTGTLPCSPTMAMTDGGILVYEAEVLDIWSVEEIASVLIHEVLHWLRDHGEARRKTRDHKLWNLACDAEINDDLVRMQLKLPGSPILPSTYKFPDGLTAEDYYSRFQSQSKKPDKAQKPGPGSGECGSCAGNRQEGEPPPGGGGAEGEAQGRSAAEVQAMRLTVAQAVRDAIKARGSVPLGLDRWATGVLGVPKIPWRSKLARVCRAAASYVSGAVDMRYGRISRRQGGIGFGVGRPVLPSYVQPVPEVVMAFDTSGSMGEAELLAGASEAQGVLEAIGARLHFLACDAKVHSSKKVSSVAEMMKLMKGGGGTDFDPIIEAVLAIRPRPNVLIIVTDGCGPVNPIPPRGVFVIWLLVGGYRRKPYPSTGGYGSSEITWGEFIEVDDA